MFCDLRIHLSNTSYMSLLVTASFLPSFQSILRISICIHGNGTLWQSYSGGYLWSIILSNTSTILPVIFLYSPASAVMSYLRMLKAPNMTGTSGSLKPVNTISFKSSTKCGQSWQMLYMTRRVFLLVMASLFFSILRREGIMSRAISSLMKYLSIVSTVRLVKTLSDQRSLIIVLCMRMAIFYPGLTSMADSRQDIFFRYGLCDWHRLIGRIRANEVLQPIVSKQISLTMMSGQSLGFT